MINSFTIKQFVLIILILIVNNLSADSNKIVISEFMAINSETLADEDGNYPDWIELHNPGSTDINLNGWYLTDKADDLKKWKFPGIMLKADAYLIVFASEKNKKDPANQLHTNFKLSGSGEFLAICEPDSTISFSYSPDYAAQRKDVSFGIFDGQEVYFSIPTPGTKNVVGDVPFAPNFSINRGFYESPFDVALSATGNGAIYYTLDGTRPSITSGTLYTKPIKIDKTTPLSAIFISVSDKSSEIVSHTYWFLNDILKQPASPEGYPMDWKKASSSDSIPADYEMDTEVCNAPEYKNLMNEAMTAIPSMNIVTSIGYLFSGVNSPTEGGIYIFTGSPDATGLDWVRPSSVEYFDPKTGDEFQINCGVKLHGGNSRKTGNSPKHGFDLAFRSEYGPSKLNFNLFDEKKAVNEFNSLVLRAGYNYSWIKNDGTQRKDAQYLNDPWAKNTQLDMGKTSAHERFVHLYINGLYWGLYNITEKLSNDFFESYMKGQEEDFDIIKEKQVVASGNINAFNALIGQMKTSLSENEAYQKIQGKNPDGTVNPEYANLLDIDNYIDYQLINYYIGNKDWNKNNWVMARNRVSNEAGFRFLCWDPETSMTDVNYNLVEQKGDAKNPMSFVEYLMGNEDFKIEFADRIQKHMIAEGGALTPPEAIARYIKLADEIDLPIIGESARWGDYRKDVDPDSDIRILYTRNDYWIPRKDDLLTNYFPNRTDIVIKQLRDKGLFPKIDAPAFSHKSGNIEVAFNLGITASSGQIYYTTDGSDPREQITSEISSQAQLYNSEINISSNTEILARAKSGDEWSALSKVSFDFDGELIGVSDLADNKKIRHGNYPNPFNVSTNIFYSLPSSGNVQIDVISIDGRLVKELFSGYQNQGDNTIKWIPSALKSGMYIYRIQFNKQTLVGKMILKNE